MIRSYGQYAGYIRYVPYKQLTEEQISGVQVFLKMNRKCEEPENPEVLIDFLYTDDQDPKIRRKVVLFTDRDDGGEPVFLLIMFDENGGRNLHIIGGEMEAYLINNLDGLRKMHPQVVFDVNTYTMGKIMDNKEWTRWLPSVVNVDGKNEWRYGTGMNSKEREWIVADIKRMHAKWGTNQSVILGYNAVINENVVQPPLDLSKYMDRIRNINNASDEELIALRSELRTDLTNTKVEIIDKKEQAEIAIKRRAEREP